MLKEVTQQVHQRFESILLLGDGLGASLFVIRELFGLQCVPLRGLDLEILDERLKHQRGQDASVHDILHVALKRHSVVEEHGEHAVMQRLEFTSPIVRTCPKSLWQG